MKKMMMALALAAAMGASAELKVGTVNMVDLVRLHPNHESNRALVKSTDKDYKAKLERQQEAAKTIADEGKKVQADLMNPMFSQSAKADAQKKLEDVQRRFLAAQQELRASAGTATATTRRSRTASRRSRRFRSSASSNLATAWRSARTRRSTARASGARTSAR